MWLLFWSVWNSSSQGPFLDTMHLTPTRQVAGLRLTILPPLPSSPNYGSWSPMGHSQLEMGRRSRDSQESLDLGGDFPVWTTAWSPGLQPITVSRSWQPGPMDFSPATFILNGSYPSQNMQTEQEWDIGYWTARPHRCLLEHDPVLLEHSMITPTAAGL